MTYTPMYSIVKKYWIVLENESKNICKAFGLACGQSFRSNSGRREKRKEVAIMTPAEPLINITMKGGYYAKNRQGNDNPKFSFTGK